MAALSSSVLHGSHATTDGDIYRLVFDSVAEQAIAVLDPQGLVTHWNAAAGRLTGHTSSQAVGHSFASLYSIEEQLSQQLLHDLAAAREHGHWGRELWHVRRDGNGYWAHQTVTPLVRDRQPVGYSVLFRDVTSQRKQSQFWQNTAEQLRAYLELSSDEFYVHDEQGCFIDVNRTACDNLGYTRDELLQLSVTDVEYDFDLAQAQKAWAKIPLGDSYLLDGRHIRKDGSLYPVEVNIRALELEGKRLFIGTARDFTEHTRREHELIYERDRFQKVVDATPGLICSFRLSPDGRASMPFASNKIREFYGVEAHEVADDFSPIMARVHPDDQSTLQRSIAQSAETMTKWRDEFRYEHPTLGMRWLSGQSMPNREADGSILWHGTMIDVTERKLAELALVENNSRLELALASAQIGVWDWNMATNQVFWSPECLTITGISEFDHTLAGFTAVVHPEDRDYVSERVQAAIQARTDFTAEFRFIRPDGEVRWATNLGRADYDDNGQPVRMLGTIRDVTELKRSALALVQNEARLRATLDTMLEGCQILDFDLRYLYLNEAAARHGRKPCDQLLGQRMVDAYPGIDQTPVYAAIHACLINRSPLRLEDVFTFADGTVGVFELSIQPVPEGIAILSVEITERRQAEELLMASEQRHRKLLASLPQAIFVQSDFKINFCNQAFLRLVGAENEAEVLGKSPLEFVPAAFHETVRARVRKMLETREPSPAIQVEFLRLDGGRVPTVVNSAPTIDLGRQSFVVSIQDITELRWAEQEMRLSEHRFRTLVQASSQIVWFADAELKSPDPIWSAFTGRPIETISGDRFIEVVHPDDRATVIALMSGMAREPQPIQTEFRMRRADGQWRWMQTQAAPLFNEQGELVEWIGSSNDVTEQRMLAAQLMQSQKLDAIGRLAGGVAHDFNNLLTVIGIHTYFLTEAIGEDHPLRTHVAAVSDATERATGLTRQLLTFTRQEIVQPKAVDVSQQVDRLLKLLRRVIGEDIQLNTQLTPSLPTVQIDPTQFEQIVMNLALNARDAMPSGGQLAIETTLVELPRDKLSFPCTRPGQFVRLAITDSGCGMSDEVWAHIFEPFFTTKPSGMGTGLGLSVVRGIVEQWHGYIFVKSTVGAGSTFEVLLPASDERLPTPVPISSPVATRGVETILLAEDEGTVRRVARMILERHGYHVIEATDGSEALRLAAEHAGQIDLLLSDVVMPNVSGPQLVEQLREQQPRLKIVFMSGYLNDRANRKAIAESGFAILEKPFKPKDLVQAVRDVLDQNIDRQTT
jgi:two-component system cell cycle sensor histidine kinase/response regulator CckA